MMSIIPQYIIITYLFVFRTGMLHDAKNVNIIVVFFFLLICGYTYSMLNLLLDFTNQN